MLVENSQPQIKLSIQETLWELSPVDIYEIEFWCNDYNKRNKWPVHFPKRFGIGLYQIYQGMHWKDGGINQYESLAASALHFTMVAAALNLHFYEKWQFTHDTLKNIPRTYINDSCKLLLFNISLAQQQIHYADANKTKRASRFKRETLAEALGAIIFNLIACIPVEIRTQCFERASTIMVKELK